MDLPVVSSCSLDEKGLRAQRERYRSAGRGAIMLQRTSRSLVVEVGERGTGVVPELVDVERECCPFFDLDWDPRTRRLSISVSERDQEPALDAIEFALMSAR
jgi:hypothetical protein